MTDDLADMRRRVELDSGRTGAQTTGRVEHIDDGIAEVWVPISGADVDEHSQAVPYPVEALDRVRAS